jgi:hypothetical protein
MTDWANTAGAAEATTEVTEDTEVVREPEDSGCWFCEPWVFCGSLQADPCPPWLPPFEPGGRRLCLAPW